MCEPVRAEEVKKFRVSGSVNKYESFETDSVEEALIFASGLVAEGYTSVVIHDNSALGGEW